MKRFLLPFLAVIILPTAANSGIPKERDVWMNISLKPGIWKVNTSEAKAVGSSITVGVSRQQEKDESSDGYYLMSWSGKTKVNCKTFKQTLTVKGLSLLPVSRTIKIEPDTIGYTLADNLCYLTGIEGYTPNENPPEWVNRVVKTIETKPKKYLQKGSVKINCDSPVWKRKPICN